ncbi:MAG: hypothetical protein IKB94_07705, partial [Clostridia bacterium]|nr:hypothetical protein [Clostridia bacterium]
AKKKNPDLRVPPAYNPLLDKCSMINGHIGPEDAKKIFAFCKERGIAPKVSLCWVFAHTALQSITEQMMYL